MTEPGKTNLYENVFIFSNHAHSSVRKIAERHAQVKEYLRNNGYEVGGSLSIGAPMSKCFNEVKDMVDYCHARGITKIVTNGKRDIGENSGVIRQVKNWLSQSGLTIELVDSPIVMDRERTPDFEPNEPEMGM